MDDKRIDAVVICSSTDTHAQMITETAQAGKHIFCEKPIALELQKIDAALQAVDKVKVKLQVGFNRRFDPSFKRARELVASDRSVRHTSSASPAATLRRRLCRTSRCRAASFST